mmetsp:Transcript_17637/g.27007  ORF Transcript_17637/g.27007 Transcript_17637/m.27007 type:complete len:330 (+) Transcript_17637:343-1332(+)
MRNNKSTHVLQKLQTPSYKMTGFVKSFGVMVGSKSNDDDEDDDDDDPREEFEGSLADLPNWSFSYALALFRIQQQMQTTASSSSTTTGDERNKVDLLEKANRALESALTRFPTVLEELLRKNDIELTGRSLSMDWPCVLPEFRLRCDCWNAYKFSQPQQQQQQDAIPVDKFPTAVRACNRIIEIFVQRNHKLWKNDHVLKWLYAACVEVVAQTKKNDETFVPPPPHPCLIRYIRCDPIDYADSFRTLPQDANPLDPALLAPAMAIDPNRRRFLQRRARGVNPQNDDNDDGLYDWRQHYEALDPDMPMMELFWRSFMPWTRVEGMPPPRR